MGIFKFFGGKISSGLSQIMKQATKLDDEVMSPIRGFVNEIQGEVWIGADADNFAEEIERDLIPKVQNVIAAIAGVQSPFSKMGNAASSKDKQMMGMAQGLGDMFDSIF